MNLTFLVGYRTYLVAAAMILAALTQLLGVDLPSFDGQSAGDLLMQAFAVIFLRNRREPRDGRASGRADSAFESRARRSLGSSMFHADRRPATQLRMRAAERRGNDRVGNMALGDSSGQLGTCRGPLPT